MRRRAAALGSVTAIALALAPGASGQDAAPDRAAIQQLLDGRADALIERDRDAYLATSAPDSQGFIRRQRRSFEGWGSVELASYDLRARWDRSGDLTRPSDRSRYASADGLAIVLVEERYRVAGFDPHPAVEDLYLTFVLRDDHWLVAEDSDLDSLGLKSARHAWDFGPLRSTPSAHFLLLQHPCEPGPCAHLAPELLEIAEAALARTESYWTAPWHGRVLIIAPATEAELTRMIQATFDIGDFIAFAYSTLEIDDEYLSTGDRVLLNWLALSGRSADSLKLILSHELLHVATRPYSGPFVPVFIEEGLAEYVGRDADPSALSFLSSEIAAGRFDAKLPLDHEFITGDGTSIYRSYQEGYSAVRYLVQRWGLDKMIGFYRRLGAVRDAPGTTRYHLDRALRRATGLGYRAFERAWAASVTTS